MITVIAEAAEELGTVVVDHIQAYARATRGGVWLPAVWSEHNTELRQALVEALGSTIPSGYMSEECGWDVTDDVSVEA